MKLPTEKTKPRTEASRNVTVICGPSGVGKSTFASNIPGALFLDCDHGLEFLAVHRVGISSWTDMSEAYQMLAKSCGEFEVVVVDTVDAAYQFLFDEVCRDAGIKFPDDSNSSKVYGAANKRFLSWLRAMKTLPVGLFLLAHSETVTKKTRTGERDYVQIAMSNRVRSHVVNNADFGFLAEIDTDQEGESPVERRVLRTKPGQHHWAKDRTGVLPDVLPMDYAAFDLAYKAALKPAQKRSKK
jgi:hypothetical protein